MQAQPSFAFIFMPHLLQRQRGECLAACTAMVLNYLKLPVDYQRLVRLLNIQVPDGTAFYHIRELTKQGITVVYEQRGTLADLQNYLLLGLPCIVAVDTVELPYWQQESTNHVPVLIGIDEENVYVHDPEFDQAPISVPIDDFLLAWMEQEERYAVLML